jgi:coenzyme F420-0:L-glutamate ligase/coenzyme F420-1:gamma-L-glutamate ligase
VPADPSPISVVALDGIPEVRIGDAVGGLIGDAIERTPGALPLTEGDVLVVTQKIVSKAEGAVIDLTGVVPGEEALEFAQRFDRDARQVQALYKLPAQKRLEDFVAHDLPPGSPSS